MLLKYIPSFLVIFLFSSTTLSQEPPLGSERIEEAIARDLLTDKNIEIRRNSAWILGELGDEDPKIIKALVRALLKDKDLEVKKASAQALGKIQSKDPEVTKALVKTLLTSSSSFLREISARTLGELKTKNPEAIKALVKTLLQVRTLLKNDSLRLRKISAWALGEIGTKDLEAIKALTTLKDKDSEMREESEQALKKIISQNPKLKDNLKNAKKAFKHRAKNAVSRAAKTK